MSHSRTSNEHQTNETCVQKYIGQGCTTVTFLNVYSSVKDIIFLVCVDVE